MPASTTPVVHIIEAWAGAAWVKAASVSCQDKTQALAFAVQAALAGASTGNRGSWRIKDESGAVQWELDWPK